MTQQPTTCHSCGAPLPTTRVRVPVYLDYANPETLQIEKVLASHDWQDEVGDCVRCTGAY
jgi:hypothetical protein